MITLDSLVDGAIRANVSWNSVELYGLIGTSTSKCLQTDAWHWVAFLDAISHEASIQVGSRELSQLLVLFDRRSITALNTLGLPILSKPVDTQFLGRIGVASLSHRPSAVTSAKIVCSNDLPVSYLGKVLYRC